MRLNNKKICLILDAIMIVCLGIICFYLNNHTPKIHYDLDRSAFPVKGIDVSAHNGKIDFEKVKADTVDFVLIKATEGTDFCDANFSDNHRRATEAGLRVGAYHYFRFDTPGEIQASHFIESIVGRELHLPLAVDVERWGNTEKYDKDSVRTELRKMIDILKARGYPVMIYTNKRDFAVFIDDNFTDVPYWICSLSANPPKIKWKFWQHSHKGAVKGVAASVDIDTYNGSRSDFLNATEPFTVKAQ